MTSEKVKVLNLYAGIGGNRKLWEDVEVTAVELDPEIAAIYQENFPQDKVMVADAHQYLLEHYNEFDFIWSSPPCQTHSKMRYLKNNCPEYEKKYPDLKLYEEIIFLNQFFKGKWVVENVISFYEPLIRPQENSSHYFWCNFLIPTKSRETRNVRQQKSQTKYFDVSNKGSKFRRTVLNNCVKPTLGLQIFKSAFRETQVVLNV